MFTCEFRNRSGFRRADICVSVDDYFEDVRKGVAVLERLDLLLVGEKRAIYDNAIATALLVDGVRQRPAVEALVHQPVAGVFYVHQRGLLLVDLAQLHLPNLLKKYNKKKCALVYLLIKLSSAVWLHYLCKQ